MGVQHCCLLVSLCLNGPQHPAHEDTKISGEPVHDLVSAGGDAQRRG